MSGLLLRKALRDLWLHRARTLLVVAAIAVALAGAGTVLVAWAMVRTATAEGYRASLPVSATLELDRVEAALLDAVRAMPEGAAARARRTLRASARIDGTARTAVLFA
ncbi:MAG TPA: hypothetical protein VFO79_07695, partial [Xanthomonadales bacterium]|nr:hypothetical protein [Xanthomonadales bacterium]